MRTVILSTFLLITLTMFLFKSSSAYFTAEALSENNIFETAPSSISITPTLSPTPSPIPSVTPTPIPGDNLCGDINVDISGNGSGSINGVFIVCENFRVIVQENETIIENNVNINSNTGGNVSNNNTTETNSTVIESSQITED